MPQQLLTTQPLPVPSWHRSCSSRMRMHGRLSQESDAGCVRMNIRFEPRDQLGSIKTSSELDFGIPVEERKRSVSQYESHFVNRSTGSEHGSFGWMRQQELCPSRDHAADQQDQRTGRPDCQEFEG